MTQFEDGTWVQISRKQMAWVAGRGKGKKKKKNGRKRRNDKRRDVRVNCPASGWTKPFWHRLLAFYLHNTENISKADFKRKEVDHTNRAPMRIDWRRLEIVDPQGGH